MADPVEWGTCAHHLHLTRTCAFLRGNRRIGVCMDEGSHGHPTASWPGQSRPSLGLTGEGQISEDPTGGGAAGDTCRLALEGVSRRFGALEAVRDVSLTVAAGEVVCLLGASGCGKSTTLRIAAGVERQNGGRVLIDGREVAGPDGFEPPERRGVGLMFQDYALFPHLSVADNVGFGLRRLDRAQRDRRVSEALELVHMDGFAAAYPSNLSGGEQQRVALARALAPRPGVMLMDEPFSGLDVPKRDRIRDETWAVLKETRTATLLVTHDPKEAMRMADRIALMREGRIVQVGAPDEIYNAPADAQAAAFFSDLNVFAADVRDGWARTLFGPVPAPGHGDGARVNVMARPHALFLEGPNGQEGLGRTGTRCCSIGHSSEGGGSEGVGGVESGRVEGVVVRSVLLGPESLIEVRLAGPDGPGTDPVTVADPVRHTGPVKVMVPGTMLPGPGTRVRVAIDPAHLFVFPFQ